MQYQWMKFIERDDICFVDFAYDKLNKLECLGKVVLDITRIPKNIGFQMLMNLDGVRIAETYPLIKIHEFIGKSEKVIAKPNLGARSIGLIISEPGLLAEYVLSGDFNDLKSFEDLINYFPSEIEMVNVENYKQTIFEWLTTFDYIVQPFYDIESEYRLYVSRNSVFEYVVERPPLYFKTRYQSNKTFRITDILKLTHGNNDIDRIISAVQVFMEISGKHYPALSIDIAKTTKGEWKLIDYGIEYAIPYIIRTPKYFTEFKTWLNESLNQLISTKIV